MKKSVLLGAVNKSSNFTTDGMTTPSGKVSGEQVVEKPVKKPTAMGLREEIDKVLTACLPEVRDLVHKHLREPTQADKMLLDAWRRLGHNDCGKPQRLDLKETARRTMSALGLACIVAYVEGYADELEATQLQIPVEKLRAGIDVPAKARRRQPQRRD